MEDHRKVKLHIEVEAHIVDPGALRAHALSAAEAAYGDQPAGLDVALGQIHESLEGALLLTVSPEALLDAIPGVLSTGVSWWLEPAQEDTARPPKAAERLLQPERCEADTVRAIEASAAKLPGLALERLGYDPELNDPDLRARSLRDATALAGAVQWAYVALVDGLIGDICLLRNDPNAIDETERLGALPELNRGKYGAAFARKFLAVTMDLGAAMAAGFESPACVAQELALRLVLDGVELLESTYPGLGLEDGWRAWAEDSLFEDLDHEMLYDPALDGISNDPAYASLGFANLDIAAWFEPFFGRVVNPYAADDDPGPVPLAGLF